MEVISCTPQTARLVEGRFEVGSEVLAFFCAELELECTAVLMTSEILTDAPLNSLFHLPPRRVLVLTPRFQRCSKTG